MRQLRTKRQDATAMLFDPEKVEETGKALVAFGGKDKVQLIYTGDEDQPYVLQVHTKFLGLVHAMPGTWIVKDEEGGIEVVPDNQITQRYDEVEGDRE